MSRKPRPSSRAGAGACVGCSGWYVFLCLATYFIGRFSVLPQRGWKSTDWGLPTKTDTLVVYIFSNNDPENLNNLRFFLRWGARRGDGADYVVVVQQGVWPMEAPEDGKTGGPTLAWLAQHIPEGLPNFVRFFVHPNECYDWGTFAWLLNSGHVAPIRYKFFVMVNSSVRGPYLPPYLPAELAWHRLLTRRLGGEVRLVGTVISCEGSPFQGNAAGEWRSNPHIQSYSIAMDEVGLETLRRDGNVLACHSDRWDAIWHSELGAALAILRAGYNIDSLLQRYQGVDWRLQENWGCNQGINPTGEDAFDGLTLSPYEVLFVKGKESLLHSSNSITLEAVKIASWLDWEETGETDIFSNEWVERPDLYKAPKVAALAARGSACFDFAYYRSRNLDLAPMSDAELWHHVQFSGQFEGRGYRFTCRYPLPPPLANNVEWMHAHGHPAPNRTKAATRANLGLIPAAELGPAEIRLRARLRTGGV